MPAMLRFSTDLKSESDFKGAKHKELAASKLTLDLEAGPPHGTLVTIAFGPEKGNETRFPS